MLADWDRRSRRSAILSDLAVIGARGQPLPFEGRLNASQMWGALYVLEGSRLGARFILAKLGRTTATRFLEHGEGARLWPTFLEILEAHPCVRRNPALALGAANAVFELFETALNDAAGAPELAIAS